MPNKIEFLKNISLLTGIKLHRAGKCVHSRMQRFFEIRFQYFVGSGTRFIVLLQPKRNYPYYPILAITIAYKICIKNEIQALTTIPEWVTHSSMKCFIYSIYKNKFDYLLNLF